MKTKEEVIQIAYGEYWEQVKDYVDENGWCKTRKGIGFAQIQQSELHIEFKKDYNFSSYPFRPKSLQNIESNNGWISINSENDLPTIGTFYTILSFDENIVEREFPNPKFTLEFNKEWWLKYVTHYQEKIMPNKPLHK